MKMKRKKSFIEEEEERNDELFNIHSLLNFDDNFWADEDENEDPDFSPNDEDFLLDYPTDKEEYRRDRGVKVSS